MYAYFKNNKKLRYSGGTAWRSNKNVRRNRVSTVAAAQVYKKSHLKRLAADEWPWSSLNGLRIASIRYIDHFLLVIFSNNDFVWHRFRYSTTFTVYVTDWLWPWEVLHCEKRSCTFRFMCQHIVDNTYILFSYSMEAKKVSNSKSDLAGHSRSPVMVPINRPHTISYYSSVATMSLCCTVFEILSLISWNLKTSRDCKHIPSSRLQ